MPTNDFLKFRFAYWEKILDRKHSVMYLYPPPVNIRDLEDVFVKAHSSVINMIEEHAKAYITEGKEPPSAIAGPVMNFVDDIASGRTPVMRAGDYITVRNFARQKPGS